MKVAGRTSGPRDVHALKAAAVPAARMPKAAALKRTSARPDSIPKSIMVESGVALHCHGVYELVPERMANGFPLWKQLGARHWMFSCFERWFVVGEEEEELGFEAGTGILASNRSHGGKMPHS